MARPRNIGQKIIELKNDGKSFSEILDICRCSKATISYHLGQGQKQKFASRQRNNRTKLHPYSRKIESFIDKPRKSNKIQNAAPTWRPKIYQKIRTFCMSVQERKIQRHKKKKHQLVQHTFTVDDVLKKFGDNPKCYLTGEPIDIYKPSSYHFDHIIPISRGGSNTIDNLGICTKRANLAKNDMTPDEFLFFCQKIIDYNLGQDT